MKTSKRIVSVSIVVALSIMGLGKPSTSAQQTHDNPMQLKRSSFRPDDRADINRYRLYDSDIIMMTVEEDPGIAKDQIEIVLKTDPNVTWWKSIVAHQAVRKLSGGYDHDRIVNSISTQDDDHGPKAMRLNFADLSNGDGSFSLNFAKGKFLGVHTEMYYLNVFNAPGFYNGLNGKRLVFTWQKDS
jgi:hypothetical protein